MFLWPLLICVTPPFYPAGAFLFHKIASSKFEPKKKAKRKRDNKKAALRPLFLNYMFAIVALAALFTRAL